MAYESKFKRDDIDELFRAILLLEDEEDCYRFFEDVCTVNEIHAIAQRLQVAKLLSEDKTYSEIEAVTKASTATISRIKQAELKDQIFIYPQATVKTCLPVSSETDRLGSICSMGEKWILQRSQQGTLQKKRTNWCESWAQRHSFACGPARRRIPNTQETDLRM